MSIRLHDCLQAASGWDGTSISCASHVVQMVEDAYNAVGNLGNALLQLDKYFLTVPALEKLAALNHEDAVHMEMITKAKKSGTAF